MLYKRQLASYAVECNLDLHVVLDDNLTCEHVILQHATSTQITPYISDFMA